MLKFACEMLRAFVADLPFSTITDRITTYLLLLMRSEKRSLGVMTGERLDALSKRFNDILLPDY